MADSTDIPGISREDASKGFEDAEAGRTVPAEDAFSAVRKEQATERPDDVQAAMEMLESNVFIGDVTSHAAAAHDAGRVLARRVQELENQWTCKLCSATFPRCEGDESVDYCSSCATVQALNGLCGRLRDQLASAERVIDYASQTSPVIARKANEYREKYPKDN